MVVLENDRQVYKVAGCVRSYECKSVVDLFGKGCTRAPMRAVGFVSSCDACSESFARYAA